MDVTNNGITSVRLARLVLTEIIIEEVLLQIFNTILTDSIGSILICKATGKFYGSFACPKNKTETRYFNYSDKTKKPAAKADFPIIIYHYYTIKWGSYEQS